ncbi:MAG: hypothetical protein AMXMBFR36_07090 [Acidobacteriota bacterium]
MSAGSRSLLPGPLPWAAGMVAIGFAIEVCRDGNVPWLSSAPLVVLLALALVRSRRSPRP